MPAPTEVAVRAATPAPTTVTAPNALTYFEQYQKKVAPLQGYQVTSNEDYIFAGQSYTQIKGYVDDIEAAFEAPRDAAHKAWKSICNLQNMFTGPANAVLDNLSKQTLAWKRILDDRRAAEERRIQAERQAEADRLIREAAEKQRLELLAAQAEVLPWEEPDEPVAESAAPVIVMPEVPVVRLPSTVPYIPGGPSTRKKPWAGRGVDLKAFILEAARRSAAGDDSLIQSGIVAFDGVRLNQLAREHMGTLGEVFPGVESFQDETLARA